MKILGIAGSLRCGSHKAQLTQQVVTPAELLAELVDAASTRLGASVGAPKYEKE
jgi:hypothetical protein